MSGAGLMIVLLLGLTEAQAQQVKLENGMNMTVFGSAENSSAEHTRLASSVLNANQQGLKMVVFKHQAATRKGTANRLSSKEIKVSNRTAKTSHAIKPLLTNLTLSSGYRRDSLNFTIAHPSGSPNVLSELAWRNLRSQQFAADYSAAFSNGVYFQSSVDFAWIIDGDMRDSDWTGDNRTREFSRSKADTTGYFVDLSLGLGYLFELPAGQHVGPIVGYELNEQHLTMNNGEQVLFSRDNYAEYQGVDPSEVTDFPLGDFSGLDSQYDARWHGPWLGFHWDKSGEKLDLFAEGQYHWLNYRAEADWNLRSDFQHPISFIHKADAEGWGAKIGARYRMNKRLTLSLDANYRNWATDGGTGETFFSDDSSTTIKLNKAKWRRNGIKLSVYICD